LGFGSFRKGWITQTYIHTYIRTQITADVIIPNTIQLYCSRTCWFTYLFCLLNWKLFW